MQHSWPLAAVIRRNFYQADFRDGDLYATHLSGFNLHYAAFNRANCRNANFSGAICSSVTFAGADLSHADFRKADMHYVVFDDVTVIGTDFRGAIGIHPDTVLVLKRRGAIVDEESIPSEAH